jgi:hypothetical protein
MTTFVCHYQAKDGQIRKKEVRARDEQKARLRFRKTTRNVVFLLSVIPKA